MTPPIQPLTPEIRGKLRALHYYDETDVLDPGTGILRPGVEARLRKAAKREGLLLREVDLSALDHASEIYDPLPHFLPLRIASTLLGERNTDYLRKCQPAGAGWLVPTEALFRDHQKRLNPRKATAGAGRPPLPPRAPWPFTDPDTGAPRISGLDVEWTTDPGDLPPTLAACLPRRFDHPAEFQASHRDQVSKEWHARPFTVSKPWHLLRWVGQVIDYYDLSSKRSTLPAVPGTAITATSTAPAVLPSTSTGPLSTGHRGSLHPTRGNPGIAAEKAAPGATSRWYCDRCGAGTPCAPGKEALATAIHRGTSNECSPEYGPIELVEDYPEAADSPFVKIPLEQARRALLDDD